MSRRQQHVNGVRRDAGKSFTARGKRLDAAPESLVTALRGLGDEDAASRLVAVYAPTHRSEARPSAR